MISQSGFPHHLQSPLSPLLDVKAKLPRGRNRHTRVIIPRELNFFTIGILCPSDVASPLQARDLQEERFLRHLQSRINTTTMAECCKSLEVWVYRQGLLVSRIPCCFCLVVVTIMLAVFTTPIPEQPNKVRMGTAVAML